MAKLKRFGMEEGARAKQNLGQDSSLSQVMELGNTYRIFARMYDSVNLVMKPVSDPDAVQKWDLLTASRLGRTADYDVCKTGFIVYDETMAELDENGKPIDLVGLEPWKRICNVLYEAAALREKKNVEAEAERTARELGEEVDVATLAGKVKEIEQAYFGGKVGDRNIMPTKKRALSKFVWKMLCQVAVVKLDGNGVPQWGTAKYAIMEMSKIKTNQLRAIRDNASFYTPGDSFIEMSYTYTGATKQEAGQSAALTGVAKNMRLSEQYPREWETLGKNFVDGIVYDEDPEKCSDMMVARSGDLSRRTDPTAVISAIRNYLATNKALAGSIDVESDTLKYAAIDLIDSGLLDSVPQVKAKIKVVADEQRKKHGIISAEEVSEENVDDKIAQEEQQDAAALAAMENMKGAQSLEQVMEAIGDEDILAGDDL